MDLILKNDFSEVTGWYLLEHIQKSNLNWKRAEHVKIWNVYFNMCSLHPIGIVSRMCCNKSIDVIKLWNSQVSTNIIKKNSIKSDIVNFQTKLISIFVLQLKQELVIILSLWKVLNGTRNFVDLKTSPLIQYISWDDYYFFRLNKRFILQKNC